MRPVVLALLLVLVPPTHAREEIVFPPDLADPSVFPGIWGGANHEGSTNKLELTGRWIHSCGNVLMNVTNFGVLGSMPGTEAPFSNAASFQWPNGSGVEYLWAAGLWVGAIRNGVPHVTTGIFDHFEFRPGRTELDRIYEARRGDQGGLRIPPLWDDDRDGVPNEDWLDGRDNDGDGRIDEDYVIISDQMFYCEFGDSDPGIRRLLPDHFPLDILVQQSSYCWGSRNRDDFIVLDYRIINQGVDPLDDLHVGFLVDFDIGRRGDAGATQDDVAGFWEGVRTGRQGAFTKKVPVSIGYMLDGDGDRGAAPGHVGITFLSAQGPLLRCGARHTPGLRNFRSFSGNAPFDLGGEPRNDEQRFEVLTGTAPRSLPIGSPFFGSRPPQRTLRQDDYKIAVSAGSFGVIDPGDTLDFQVAIVAGGSFEDMMENAVQAHLSFQGQWHDCDGDPETGVNGFETYICGTPDYEACEFRRDPCDESCDTGMTTGVDPRCNLRVRPDSCYWFNNDCAEERASGIRTGVGGKECRLTWFVESAPPPPRMRVQTRENQVEIFWDNRSETTADEVLGVVDFESYRLWRAENWTRPLGTSARTGPSSELWSLLGEFDLPRNGIGAERGLRSIRYEPTIPPYAVAFYREWLRAHPDREPPDLPGLTRAQRDTATALARAVRYYHYVDPPFIADGATGGPCPTNKRCPSIETPVGPVSSRCNPAGVCQETAPPPKSGVPYFYSVTATDHRLQTGPGSDLVPVGRGLAGNPATNFEFVYPITDALPPERYAQAEHEIRVVPNPATKESMAAWRLNPNDDDPSGTKIEFHRLPQSKGKVTIFTLSGDRVQELTFDGSEGNGTLVWDLVSRNRQEVTSGVYLYVVEAEDPAFERFISKFVVVR